MSCFVYLLVDPWGDGNPPFYIGMSKDPWHRFYVHLHDFTSAPYPRLRIFHKYNVPREKILTIYKEFPTRRQAYDAEHHLVTTTAGLVNRQNAGRLLR